MSIITNSICFDGCIGEFKEPNVLFSKPKQLFQTNVNANPKSGAIIDMTFIVPGIENIMDIDFFLIPNSVEENVHIMSYDVLKTCIGRIRIDESDFSYIGDNLIANLYNLNMTYHCHSLYIFPVFQGGLENRMIKIDKPCYLNIGMDMNIVN